MRRPRHQIQYGGRWITNDTALAVLEKRDFSRDNTKVIVDKEHSRVWVSIFGNQILRWDYGEGAVMFCMCGHGTPTTRERLNGLFEALHKAGVLKRRHSLYQLMGQQILRTIRAGHDGGVHSPVYTTEWVGLS